MSEENSSKLARLSLVSNSDAGVLDERVKRGWLGVDEWGDCGKPNWLSLKPT